MHERMSNTELIWMRAVPGHIPDQAVMFANRSHNDTMFVVRVNGGSFIGSFVPGGSCAEYYFKWPRCTTTFDFLVMKYGEQSIATDVTIWHDDCHLRLLDIPFTHLPLVPHTCFSELCQHLNFNQNSAIFHSRKCIWNCRLPKWRPFCPGGDELNIDRIHESLTTP